MAKGWRADEADVDAVAGGAPGRSVRGARAASDAERLGDPRFRSRRRRGRALDPRRRADRRRWSGARATSSRACAKGLKRAPGLSAARRATRRRRRSYEDAYAFGPALGPLDDYLLVEGTHRQLYERLGAQITTHEGVDGVLFAVWAPQRLARVGRRRFQSLGRPALPDAQALRQRPVGDFRPRHSAPARSINTRSSRPTASCSR